MLKLSVPDMTIISEAEERMRRDLKAEEWRDIHRLDILVIPIQTTPEDSAILADENVARELYQGG